MDIGGHFSHWTLDFKNADFISGMAYPSLEVRTQFIDTYLAQLELERGQQGPRLRSQSDGNNNVDERKGQRSQLLIEAEFYAMVNALFVALWFVQPSEAYVDCDQSRAFMVSFFYRH